MKPDAAEIRRCLTLVAAPGQIVELRLLNVQKPGQRFPVKMGGYYSDCEKLAKHAYEESAWARGAYITLNPVNPALLARAVNRLRIIDKDFPLTTDADILVRRWLPIDVDPVRPSGISSTDMEHELAIARALQVRDVLRAKNWPEPILSDSGNGAHLLYGIEVPADDDGLVKRCLQSLAFRFDDDRVKIDQVVFNPARIWRLYGTVSRKGDDMPDRPHRLAQILEAP